MSTERETKHNTNDTQMWDRIVQETHDRNHPTGDRHRITHRVGVSPSASTRPTAGATPLVVEVASGFPFSRLRSCHQPKPTQTQRHGRAVGAPTSAPHHLPLATTPGGSGPGGPTDQAGSATAHATLRPRAPRQRSLRPITPIDQERQASMPPAASRPAATWPAAPFPRLAIHVSSGASSGAIVASTGPPTSEKRAEGA